MKEINHYINEETREFRRKSTLHKTNYKGDNMIVRKLKEDFNQWIFDLKQLVNNGLCRQALKEIEKKKYKYELLKSELWKYRLIKAKAILKIIRIKMSRHSKEIILENSSQNLALKFWFNQIFLILEQLILEIRPDLNHKLDNNDINILRPIQ